MATTIGGIATGVTTPLSGAELLEFEQAGVTKKGTAQDIADLATVALYEEGVLVGLTKILNFVGAAATVTEVSPGVFEIAITGGGSALAIEEEGVEADAAVVRINFTGTGATATQISPGVIEVNIPGGGATAPALIPFFISGLQPAATMFPQFVFTESVTFAANFAGSQLYAAVAPTVERVYDIQKNGVSVGSITVAIGSNVGVFTSVGGAPVSFIAGDRLAVITPAVQDATLATVSVNMHGSRV